MKPLFPGTDLLSDAEVDSFVETYSGAYPEMADELGKLGVRMKDSTHFSVNRLLVHFPLTIRRGKAADLRAIGKTIATSCTSVNFTNLLWWCAFVPSATFYCFNIDADDFSLLLDTERVLIPSRHHQGESTPCYTHSSRCTLGLPGQRVTGSIRIVR